MEKAGFKVISREDVFAKENGSDIPFHEVFEGARGGRFTGTKFGLWWACSLAMGLFSVCFFFFFLCHLFLFRPLHRRTHTYTYTLSHTRTHPLTLFECAHSLLLFPKRRCTYAFTYVGETLRVLPRGTCEVQTMLMGAAESFKEAGRLGLLTPGMLYVCEKPGQ